MTLLSVDKDSFVRGRNATLQVSEMMINTERERERWVAGGGGRGGQREGGRERERVKER